MIRILHVDDESSFREMFKFITEHEGGYKVDSSEDARKALEMLERGGYDAIVSDFKLPGMDGIELLKIVRVQGKYLPFVMFTGRGGEEIASESVKEGADFYVRKGDNAQAQIPGLLSMVKGAVERQRAEEALRRSEQLYRKLTESLQDMIFVVHADGKVIYANPYAAARLGFAPGDLVGLYMQKLFPPEAVHKHWAAVKRTLEEGKPSKVEEELTVLPRPKMWVETTLTPLRNDKGEVYAVLWVARETTERKKIEEELKASESKYRRFVANIRGIAFEAAADFTPVLLDGSVHEITGYEPGEFLSRKRNWREIIHPTDLPKILEDSKKIRDSPGTTLTHEYRIVRKDGHVRWLREVVQSIGQAGSSATPLMIHGLLTDVTERVETEEKYRDLAGSITDLFYVLDENLKYTYYNKASESVEEAPDPRGLLGKTITEWRSSPQADAIMEMYRKVLETKKPNSVVIEYLVPSSNLKRYFEVSAYPASKGLVCLARDVTERKLQEESLKAANEKLNLMGHVTRHDALNQLSALLGWLEIAEDKSSKNKHEIALANIRRAAEAIQKELEFTADYQQVGVEEPTWLKADAEWKMGVSGLVIEDVTVETDLAGLELFADPMLHKVFHNLMDDSLRHGKRVTEITVSRSETADGLTIIYEDNGVGIPEADKQAIFELGTGHHTGYGLSVAREILGITGLQIEETGVAGEGARFEIHVPRGSYRTSRG